MRNSLLRRLGKIFATIFAVGCATVLWGMDSRDPKVYFLHTQQERYLPDLVFKISSVPLAVASLIHYRRLALKVAPATQDAVNKAFHDADVLIIGTHGTGGRFAATNGRLIGPPPVQNPYLKLLYSGACYFGLLRKDWQKSFPGAQIIAYDGLTYPTDGWIYLVFRSWMDLLRLT